MDVRTKNVKMKYFPHDTEQDEEMSITKSISLSSDYGAIPIEKTIKKQTANQSYIIGVLCMLCSSLFLSFQGVCVKIGKDLQYDAFELVLARGIVQGIINLIFHLIARRVTKTQKDDRLDYISFTSSDWVYLIIRGICAFSIAIMLYDGVQLLPLGDAMSLFSTFPIWTIIAAYIFLKEKINKIHIISLISCMMGVVLITQPTFIFRTDATHINGLGVFLELMSAILNGLTFLCLRKLKHIKAIYPIYSFSIGCIVGSIIYGLIAGIDNWQSVNMDNYYDIVLLISMGVMGYGGQYFMTKSTQYVAASVGSLVRSTDVGWAYTWQILIFHVTPTYITLSGAACIVVAVIVIAIQKIIK